jgi:hypothetical protein
MPKNSKPAETETAIIVAIVRRIPEVDAERNSARISRTGKYECQRQQSKKRSQFPSEPSRAAQAGADDAARLKAGLWSSKIARWLWL